MNLLDIFVIIFILLGALVGFKRGFTKELTEAVGFIVIVILAYIFKNPLSVFFYEHMPFLNVGFLKGAEVLNILMYEILAFLVVLYVGVSIALYILSELFKQATEYKEENELTI